MKFFQSNTIQPKIMSKEGRLMSWSCSRNNGKNRRDFRTCRWTLELGGEVLCSREAIGSLFLFSFWLPYFSANVNFHKCPSIWKVAGNGRCNLHRLPVYLSFTMVTNYNTHKIISLCFSIRINIRFFSKTKYD